MAAKWTECIISQGSRERPGRQTRGRVLQCEGCSGKRFLLFLVGGHDHAHAQCVGCQECFCLDPDDCAAKDDPGKNPAADSQ